MISRVLYTKILFLTCLALVVAAPQIFAATENSPGATLSIAEHEDQVPDKVGLDEKLGESLPLDTPFTDETGKLVTLRELVKGPTLILPIYYKCPNVCNFMQGGVAGVLKDVARKAGEEYQVISISFD